MACGVIMLSMPMAAAGEDAARSIPANVLVSDKLQPIVRQLIARSPTFRAQCDALASAPRVRVRLQFASARLPAFSRARGRIVRHADGSIDATLEVPVSVDLPELIVHEMEHVLEQADDVDLAALVRAPGAQATVDAYGAYETRRARDAGVAAAEEWRALSKKPSPRRQR